MVFYVVFIVFSMGFHWISKWESVGVKIGMISHPQNRDFNKSTPFLDVSGLDWARVKKWGPNSKYSLKYIDFTKSKKKTFFFRYVNPLGMEPLRSKSGKSGGGVLLFRDIEIWKLAEGFLLFRVLKNYERGGFYYFYAKLSQFTL